MSDFSNRAGTDKGQRFAQRLSHILALLHQGERIEKHALAAYFNVGVRTIERDLHDRLYGIAERNSEGGGSSAIVPEARFRSTVYIVTRA